MLGMREAYARIVLDAREIGPSLFRFKSPLSRVILLQVAREGGQCELRTLLKRLEATSVAARQHIQSLVTEGFLSIQTHPSNRRCKVVSLTEHSRGLLAQYEHRLHSVVAEWVAVSGT